MTEPKWVISPFSSELHRRDTFSCGHPALDTYIRQLASQDVKRKMARVFVACEPAGNEVRGYYTLSAAGFKTCQPKSPKNSPIIPFPPPSWAGWR